MTDDQRRLTFLRDNVEHLAEEKSALESLLSRIQTGSEQDVLEIRRRLQAGEDMHILASETHSTRHAEGQTDSAMAAAKLECE
jgi:hypothetical protein